MTATIINTSTCLATLKNVVIDPGGSTVYTEGFDSTTGGWSTATVTGAVSRVTTPVHSGAGTLRIVCSGAGTTVLTTRSFGGLTVGRRYRFRAWARGATGTGESLQLMRAGDAFVTPSTLTTTYVQYEGTFRATATTETLQFATAGSAANTCYVDDVTLVEADLLGNINLKPLAARVTLDDRRAPFISAEVTLAVPAEYVVGSIDPRQSVRLLLSADQAWTSPTGLTPQSNTWDLTLTGRRVSADNSTMVLTATSDEAALLVTGRNDATADIAFYNQTAQLMLRSVINTLLASRGTSLQTGAADADVSAVTTATNIIPNPNFRLNTTGWDVNGPNSTRARQTGLSGGPVAGVTTYDRVTWSGNSGLGAGGLVTPSADAFTVEPNVTYKLSGWVRSSVSKSVRVLIIWRDAAGTAIGSQVFGSDFALAANTWQQINALGSPTSPATAAKVSIGVLAASSVQWASGNTLDTLGWMMRKTATAAGIQSYDPFDGDTATDTYYTYAYTNGAGTPSVRTPIASRDPESLLRKPGVFDWDFLAVLVAAAGLRLFCDEDRKWYLVDPATYTVAGTIAVTELVNLVSGDDEVSIEHDEWADGIVQPYIWNDIAGVRHEVYDVAGTGTVRMKPMPAITTAYPGPGAAAAILARAAGRGAEQSLRALTDLTALPGMALTSDLPGVPDQTGRISAVTFEWSTAGGSDEMTLTPKGLVAA